MKTNARIQSTLRRPPAGGNVPQPFSEPESKPRRASSRSRLLVTLMSGLALLLASVTAQSATVTFDFSNGTLQGWHNRVWDLSANAGAGGWVGLEPNAQTMPGSINGGSIEPASGDNNLFGIRSGSTQVDPVGGQNDNHLNTLWLRSPQFTLDGSGDLTGQMARGMANGPVPANEAAVSYIAADHTAGTGWKGLILRRVSDGAFLLAKPRTTTGDAMATVTFTAAELTPYVGVICTLELINSERANWGWLSMDNVTIPGALVPPADIAVATPSLVNGSSVPVTVTIPSGHNAAASVTVYVTNSNPAVLTLNGSASPVLTLTFAAGAANSQIVTAAGFGLGFAKLTTGSASLVSDSVGLSVLTRTGLIGRWLTGPQDLQDKSGYTPAGTHDGMMSSGLTATYSPDVPPGAALDSYSLDLAGGAVLITNSTAANAGYRPTFDETTARQMSVAFWAKGLPSEWNPYISKWGEGSAGWQVRKRGNSSVSTFTVRGTSGEDDPFDGSTLIDDGAWHHFAATWDGVAGVRKFYVDGKLNSMVGHDFGPMGLATVNYLTLGGRTGAGSVDPGNTFFGQIFDVQIYGTALNGSAVQNIFTANSGAIVAYADNPVIDLSKTGVVSVSIPAAANASATVTVFVTNTTPTIVSLAGAVANVVTLTFPAGGITSQTLTLTGLSEGQAQLACAATGLTGASATVKVYGPHLIGHWLNGAENYADNSSFSPAGTHDGSEVGSVGTLTFVSDTPPSKPGKAAQFGGGVGLAIANSSLLDTTYAPTFDDVIARQFSVAFWAKGIPGTWNGFVSKRGEDAIGWQMRRSGGITEAFTLRGSGSGNADGVGSIAINDGLWHHYAAVWDGHTGTRKCYVDGILDPSINLTNDFAPMGMAPNHHLVLGGREQSGVSSSPTFEGFYNGLLYDVRMYNYPLSETEVKTLSFVAALKVIPAQRSLKAPQTMAVDIVLPAGANQSQPVTVQVLNNTPAIASLVGAVGNIVTLNYPVGGSLTQQVTVAGIADGKARLTATGGGFAAGSDTFSVWAEPGSKLIGRWISGAPDLIERSGFRPAGTHDGVAVGANAAALMFSADVPAVAPLGDQSLDLSAGNVAVMITNSSTVELGYAETFDNQMANKFSITFWAKGTFTDNWNPWVSKRGENDLGYQVRRHSEQNPIRPTFTLRGTSGEDDPWPGATVDSENWHHYAATWDGTTGVRRLYVDGVSVISLANDFGPFAPSTADHLILGGRDQGGFGNFFPGQLYDVRIYSYALAAAEVGVLVNPPTTFSLALTHQSIPQGDTVQLVVTLPSGATATTPVTVYLTNNSPSVVTIIGPTAIVFPIGSLVQTVNLQTIGAGQINITAGAAAIGDAALATVNLVVAPKLIGHWLNGAADLTDKSGYTAAGTHDGVVIGANPELLAYSSDVPAGFTGQSLDLTGNAAGTVGVVITNSATSDGAYLPTFDGGISSAFSVSVWAKGVPGNWNGFVSKRGEDTIGWQIRRSGGNTEAFTIRGTASGNYDGVGSVVITDDQWRHFAAVWDGVTGTRKCYVNGVLDPSVNLTGDFGPLNLAPDHHLALGAREQGGTGSYEGWFNGKLFDVRIYNYAITPAEVASLITATSNLPTLTIQSWTGNQVRISWPAAGADAYSLQQSQFVNTGWAASGLIVTVEGSEKVAYAPINPTPLFFRLKR